MKPLDNCRRYVHRSISNEVVYEKNVSTIRNGINWKKDTLGAEAEVGNVFTTCNTSLHPLMQEVQQWTTNDSSITQSKYTFSLILRKLICV